MRRKDLLVVLTLGAVAIPLGATMVERLTLEQMVERSERIVQGRCRRTWSAWDEAHQFIWTHCEMEVADAIKGGAARTLVVSEPGGVVDGMEMTIEGVAHYQTGEEVVLFLYRTPIGFWRTRGLGQGKYRIRGDSGNDRRVRADLSGVSVLEPRRAPLGRSTDLRRLDGVSLDEFKATVRALVARPRQAREN